MKDLIHSGRALLADLASTLLFLALYALTGNVKIAVIAGMALALAQIGLQFARRKPVDALQWVSLVVVLASGVGTLHTHNPVYIMLKPSVIYLLVGMAMLERGWMLRYMPAIALDLMTDIAIGFGYVWAGLMFCSAALNLVLALTTSLVLWGIVISIWGAGSKIALFFVQYAVMRIIGRRRWRARNPGKRPDFALIRAA